MAIIVGDAMGLQQRHHPQNVPHLVDKEDQGLSTEGKNHFKTSKEGFYQPPSPLYHGRGMNLRTSEG